LEIHMDKNPVATINPNTIKLIFVPMSAIIVNAIRRCKFHFSIASAIINPPINKNIVSSPYEEAVKSISSPLVIGNKTRGNKEVTGIGTASVIHHVAIQMVLAAIAIPSCASPSGRKNNSVRINNKGNKISLIKCETEYLGYLLFQPGSCSAPSDKVCRSLISPIFDSFGLTKKRNKSFTSSCHTHIRFQVDTNMPIPPYFQTIT